MNESKPNSSPQLLKNDPFINTSELVQQHLLYMNNLMSQSSTGTSQSPLNLSNAPTSQIDDHQLCKLRQEMFNNSNNFYANPYNFCQFPEASKPAPVPAPYNRLDANRYRYLHEEPKPQHSYIGLIAIAILSMPDEKMVLSDIYQHILDNYPYFRNRGPGWRNSIRHNLSLNDCFVKAGRSANGKGHYWAIHPANLDDFKKGDFRRRKAQRKVRRHMGLDVPDDEDDEDSPISSPIPLLDKLDPVCPSPFVNPAVSLYPPTMAGPLGQTANPFLYYQAFNLFNTLRFAMPPVAQNFNETLYRQLMDLNRQRQQDNVLVHKQAPNRKQFDIDSILAQEHRTLDRDSTPDSEDRVESFKRQKLQVDDKSNQSSPTHVDTVP